MNNEGSDIIYRLINDLLFIDIISLFIRTILALPYLDYLLILHFRIVLILFFQQHPPFHLPPTSDESLRYLNPLTPPVILLFLAKKMKLSD